MLTRLSGRPLWADRTEDIAFNSYPAALNPDHTGTHYITSANSIQLDKVGKKHGQFANGDFVMQPFKPGVTAYRCCPHNLSMGWPYYAEELWLATADQGLCASLYAASAVRAKVADGAEITIMEDTGYPFSDTVKLRVDNTILPCFLALGRGLYACRYIVYARRIELVGELPARLQPGDALRHTAL